MNLKKLVSLVVVTVLLGSCSNNVSSYKKKKRKPKNKKKCDCPSFGELQKFDSESSIIYS